MLQSLHMHKEASMPLSNMDKLGKLKNYVSLPIVRQQHLPWFLLLFLGCEVSSLALGYAVWQSKLPH